MLVLTSTVTIVCCLLLPQTWQSEPRQTQKIQNPFLPKLSRQNVLLNRCRRKLKSCIPDCCSDLETCRSILYSCIFSIAWKILDKWYNQSLRSKTDYSLLIYSLYYIAFLSLPKHLWVYYFVVIMSCWACDLSLSMDYIPSEAPLGKMFSFCKNSFHVDSFMVSYGS